MLPYNHPDSTKSHGLFLLGHFSDNKILLQSFLDIVREFLAIQNALQNPGNTLWFLKDNARPNRTVEVFNFLYEHSDDHAIALDY